VELLRCLWRLFWRQPFVAAWQSLLASGRATRPYKLRLNVGSVRLRFVPHPNAWATGQEPVRISSRRDVPRVSRTTPSAYLLWFKSIGDASCRINRVGVV